MKLIAFQVFNTFYTTLCVTITLGMSGFWIYKFALDENLFNVELRDYYDTKDDVYPSISMCFNNPFITSITNGSGMVSQSILKSYLSGDDKFEMVNINYENLTFSLHDYLIKYWVLWENGTEEYFLPSNYKWNPLKISYNGFWKHKFYKCYSIEMPVKDIDSISVLVKNNVFPQGIRPFIFGLLVIFHYPNQLLRPLLTMKYMWKTRKDEDGYAVRFIPENVEIFRRRSHSFTTNCQKKWEDYDNEVKEYFMQKVGCRPPYQSSKTNLSICSTREEMEEVGLRLSLGIKRDYPPPCRSMDKINYKYEEVDLSETKYHISGHFWTTILKGNSGFKVNN